MAPTGKFKGLKMLNVKEDIYIYIQKSDGKNEYK